MRLAVITTLIGVLSSVPSLAGVGTLKGTTDIEDAVVYSWADCDGESSGEECRRYNTGNLILLPVGNNDAGQGHNVFFRLPGWDGVLPDSSKLQVYCRYERDAGDRKLFLYPLTVRIYEGNEEKYNVGDYPEPDSGVTWNHAYLDVGDGDSSNFSSPGGDYNTGIACTTTITGVNQYFTFDNFNRILNYWDTSGQDYGFAIINQDAFPGNTSRKTLRSSEGSSSEYPLVLLFTADENQLGSRRRRITSSLSAP